MSMTATWALPGWQKPMTPGRKKNDQPEDKLILKILDRNARTRPEPILRGGKSSASTIGQSGKSSTSTMRTSASASSLLSAGSLTRAASTADLGVLCYSRASLARRDPITKLKTWERGPITGKLRVDVVRAGGLLAMDNDPGRDGPCGSSDPYVVVSVGGRKRKTQVKFRSLEPTWDQSFEFRGLFDTFLESGARFEVFDWDEVGMDDPLGSAAVKLQPEMRMATEATTQEFVERLNTQGKIEFRITWIPDAPRERAAPDAPLKERVPIPVLLPNKFEYVTDMYGKKGIKERPSRMIFTPDAFRHISDRCQMPKKANAW